MKDRTARSERSAQKTRTGKGRAWRAALAAVVAVSFVGVGAQLATGCQQSPTVVPVRSLLNSGKASFVCMHPNTGVMPLTSCTSQLFTSVCQYEFEDDAGNPDAQVTYDDAGIPLATIYPHIYAMVPQESTGQVAVVDVSSLSNGVLDENPAEPGSQFLPVGNQPTAVVSTPGGFVSFVTTAEVGKQGIWAIPSSVIRPAESWGNPDMCIGISDAAGVQPPELTSWPACFLQTRPGQMLLIEDPAQSDGNQRPSCSSAYEPVTKDEIAGQQSEAGHGRQKLVIALPDLGGIAVYDAQSILDRTPGSFDPCGPPEAWLPLKADLTGLADEQPLPTGPVPGTLSCANPAPLTPPLKPSYTPQPGGMSYADGKLYVADLGAPVIHVISMREYVPGLGEVPTPCNPIEEAPLLPTSIENPQEVIFTTTVAVAPVTTPDNKRYLYATDQINASVMVFDVGPTATSRRPLVRQNHPEWNPLQPRDRILFSAPAKDIILVEHDIPAIDPITGVAAGGVLCDPDPTAVSCVATAHNCDPGTSYRTSADYTTGAAPQKLRGEFAFAALTNGKVAVIEIDDFDSPCRGPVADTALAGCSSNASGLITSQEVSCNIVEFGAARSANYMAVGTDPGNHVPGIQTYPQLYSNDGSALGDTSTQTAPHMVATLPTGTLPVSCTEQACDPLGCGITCDTLPGCPLELFVGGTQTPLDVKPGQCNTACQPTGAPCSADTDCCADLGGSFCPTTADKGLNAGLCRPKTCDNTGAACDPAVEGAAVCAASNCPNGCLADGTPCTIPTSPEPADGGGGSGGESNADTCVAKNCYLTTKAAFSPGGIGANNTLVMNLEDPRVHVVDQNWTVTFEGAIPGYTTTFGALSALTPSSALPATARLTNTDAQFCDHGVLGQLAFKDMMAAQAAETPKQADAVTNLTPQQLADYVQVTSDVPAATDPYWTDPGTTCNYSSCFDLFGPTDTPTLETTRDLFIWEAFEDHLELIPRTAVGTTPVTIAEMLCCFPGEITFNIRVGNQWAVVGDQSGFIHHVVADASTGVCRNSCDATLTRKNARVVETAPTLQPTLQPDRRATDIDPTTSFQNPMFRFAITSGTTKCAAGCAANETCAQGVCATKVAVTPLTKCKVDADCGGPTSRCDLGGEVCAVDTDCVTGVCNVPTGKKVGTCGGGAACFQPGVPVPVASVRDSVYRFTTSGSFAPMLIGLATDTTSLIAPNAINYLPQTTELVVSDGNTNGIILLSLQTATVSRSFF